MMLSQAFLLSTFLVWTIFAACDIPFTKTTLLAKCRDNTASAYFFLPSTTNSKDFIIFLGDSQLCSSGTDCNNLCSGIYDGVDKCASSTSNSQDSSTLEELFQCFFTDLNCVTTSWTVDNVCPTTILKEFPQFNRVFVPQCSFDMFLGRNSGNLFNGAIIFDQVIASLQTLHGLSSASRVILSGTRQSGVGALNLMSLVKSVVNPLSIEAIVDSSWLLNIADFNVARFDAESEQFKLFTQLKTDTKQWLDEAQLDAECKSFFGTPAFVQESDSVAADMNVGLVNCLFPSQLLARSTLLQNSRILFLQNQYDFTQFSQLGLLDTENQAEFADTASFVNNLITFVETIGSSVRLTVQAAYIDSGSAPHSYFVSSCADHGPVFPTSLHQFDTREEDIGVAGSALVQRTESSWEKVKINSVSVRDAVTEFVNHETNRSLVVDRCGTFLCGSQCELQISPFVVQLKTADAAHGIIVFVAIALVSTGWLGFTLTYLRVLVFRMRTKLLWSELESREIMRRKSKDSLELSTREDLLSRNENEEFFNEVKQRTNIVSLMVTNLTYQAPARRPGDTPFTILKKVNISVRPREVHVLMGPSGSGKSTLLDILATTRNSGTMTGTHYINGVPSHLARSQFLQEWLKMNLSYVRQQDVLFPLLTVRQHLTHAAWLMLPESMKASDKVRRVYLVARLLGLEHTLDTKIGDGGIRIEGGISGGERRRVSVATQLLKLPAALVLDEPTSGLDSANALMLVGVLNQLAHRANVCVFLTIHQPRREIFNLLDRITILLDGKITFSGSPDDSARFFKFKLDEVNIGDDILDKLENLKKDQRQLNNITAKYQTGALGKQELERIRSEESYLTSKKASELRQRLKQTARREGRYSWTKVTSTWTTIKILLSRTILRGGFDIERTAFISLAGGILVGTVFLDNDSYNQSAGLAYLITSTMIFLQSTFLGTRYQLEKGMWSHEKDAGTTVSWQAFLTSLFLRNMVTSTVEGLSFAFPAYFMGRLNTDDPSRFQLFLILLVLVATTIISQSTLVEIDRIRRGGTTGPDLRQAALVNMTLLSLGALFNGFIIRLEDIPSFLQWVPYCMITFWGFVGILVNNFRDFEYPCEVNVLECATRTGDSFITNFRYDRFDVYQAILALCAMLVLFHAAGVLIFFLRFVMNNSSLERELDDKEREYSEQEQREGFIGRTMNELINVNLQQSAVQKTSSKASKESKKSKAEEKQTADEFEYGAPSSTKIKIFAPNGEGIRNSKLTEYDDGFEV